MKEADKCQHCAAGDKPIKMRGGRQYIHRVNWRNVVCPEEGIMKDGSKRVSGPVTGAANGPNF